MKNAQYKQIRRSAKSCVESAGTGKNYWEALKDIFREKQISVARQ